MRGRLEPPADVDEGVLRHHDAEAPERVLVRADADGEGIFAVYRRLRFEAVRRAHGA